MLEVPQFDVYNKKVLDTNRKYDGGGGDAKDDSPDLKEPVRFEEAEGLWGEGVDGGNVKKYRMDVIYKSMWKEEEETAT